MKNILDYEPKLVWKFFHEISQIPRESHHEELIKDYLIEQAKKYNFRYATDDINNVYYYIDATKGYENLPSVALQGHMDMVCVKSDTSNHNFRKDPLDLFIDGDWLRAKDTTLGADNGIAIAMILAIFADPNSKHGPLEAIITVQEETGLYGALAVEEKYVKSKMMINLDSEDEGIIFIGCAGGIEVDATSKPVYEKENDNYKYYELNISGLKGGHSGAEIHTNRANSLKMASDILYYLQKETKIALVSLRGGTKRNVIPSTATAIFALLDDSKLNKVLDNLKSAYKDMYEISDPNFKIEVKKSKKAKTLSLKDSKNIIDTLFITTTGVYAYSSSLDGIVETSSNFAIANISEDEGLHLITSCRSNLEGSKDITADRIAQIWSKLNDVEVKIHGSYPSWKPDVSLKLHKFCAKAYEDYTKKKPEVTAIHAGLECGIINSRISGMDSVSFGPDIRGAHSVEEKLSISSTKNIFGFLEHLLTIIR